MSTTFYLGAGASANTLPCVADLTMSIKRVFEFLYDNRPAKHTFSTEAPSFSDDNNDVNDIYILSEWDRLREIEQRFLSQLGKSLSIDTVARVYHIQERRDEYLELKGILVASFLLWEHKNGIDKRYENFWATVAITDEKKRNNEPIFKGFAPKLNIVSWNYDNQIESSLLDLFSKSKFAHNTIEKHIHNRDISAATGIPYMKLNGIANLSKSRKYLSREQKIKFKDFQDSELTYLMAALILFPSKFEEECNELRFCWEGIGINNREFFKKFKDKIADTKTLVVVGYSFPSINHRLDKEIVSNFHSLKDVYFQGANKQDSGRIMDAFKSVRGAWEKLNLYPIESAGFFIPPEVTLPDEGDNVAVW